MSKRPLVGQRRHAASRRGAVMVLFALLAVGFLAMLGIAIDLGLARLTQKQMQGAADSVAVEALRERDRVRVDEAQTDAELRDVMRRVLNGRIASWLYADGLSVSGENEAPDGHGAGGYVLMSGGQGALNWGRTIEEIGWSKPRLAPNYEIENSGGTTIATARNEAHGDIVSGAFSPLDGDGKPVTGPGGSHFYLESAYQRVDFSPASAPEAPHADSLLVRLRRTRHDYEGFDPALDDDPSVSTTGPTLPMLFSAGGVTMGGDPASEWSPRHTGFAIRATAIATARRAVRVGTAVDPAEIELMEAEGTISPREAALLRVGVAPIAFAAQWWPSSAPGNVWTPIGNGEEEMLLVAGTGGCQWPALFVTDPNANQSCEIPPAYILEPRARQVGDPLAWPPVENDVDPASLAREEAYLPMYRRTWTPETGIQHRVIGFCRVRIEVETLPDPVEGDPTHLIRVIKLGNELAPDPLAPWIAPRNASARFDGTQAADLSKQEWDELLYGTGPNDPTCWQGLGRAIRAPALAR